MSYIGKGVETVTFNTATTLDVAGNITLGGTVDGRDVATDGTKLDTITSGAIADILQDTTPQLGGNLDLNTSNVIGTGNINVTGSITGTSFVSTGNMSFTNNSKAIFGTSPSLEIYHDGSNSILDDVGAGNFKMQLAGADKLEITSTGVDVTGTVTADGLIVQGNSGTSSSVVFGYNENGGEITLHDETGAAATLIDQASNNTRLLELVNGSDLVLGLGGSNTTGNIRFNSAGYSTAMTIDSIGNVGIGCVPDSALEIRTATNSSSDTTYLKLSNLGENVGHIDFENGNGNLARITGTKLGSGASANDGILTFSTAFDSVLSERVLIDNNGNVGIGTSSPGELLHLSLPSGTNGDIVRLSRSAGAYSFQLGVSSGSTSNLYISDSSNNKIIDFTSSGNIIQTAAIQNSAFVPNTPSTWNAFEIFQDRGVTNAASGIAFRSQSGTAPAGIVSVAGNTTGGIESLAFMTATGNASYERMRIDSNGKLCVGTSSPVSLAMLTIQPTDTNRIINTRNFNTSTQYHHVFQNSAGTTVGSIQCNNASTAYNTTSDYRLKTDVTYDWDATSRLKQLKPARFAWIADGDDAVPVDGFLAHEVQGIVPEAITGTKDAIDEDGNPEYQGIDQSKLVPLLVKTIQELEARIAALENT